MKEKQEIKTDEKLIRKCRNILSEDIVFMIREQPFHSKIILNAKKVFLSKAQCEKMQIPIAAVNVINGTVNLYLNPEGYLALPRSERVGVLIHEMMHIELGHLFRGKGKNHQLYNIATDLSINQLIPNNKTISLPENTINIKNVKQMFEINSIPERKNADYYYDYLKKVLESRGQEVSEGDLSEEIQKQIEEFFKDMMESAGLSGSGSDSEDGEQMDGEGPSENKGPINWHRKWEENEGSDKMNEAVIKEMVKQAVRRDPGTIPGELQAEIQKWLTPQVDWRSVFNRYAAKFINWNKTSTWRRVNRRHSLLKGYRRNKKWKIFVGVDTSGSVSDENLEKFAAEIRSMHQRGAEITIIECDMKIQNIYKFDGKLETLKFKGRGGTTFIPPFKEIAKEKQVDLVIYLTDGGGVAPDSFKIPTIWVITPEGHMPYDSNYQHIKWGKEVKLN